MKNPISHPSAAAAAVLALAPLAAAGGGSTTRVSLGTGSLQANNPSVNGDRQWAVSADGRFVVFRSAATNLDPLDPDSDWDVYLRDTLLDTTALVSVGMGGAPSDGTAWECDVSDDGRYVAFSSSASNLAPNDTNGVADVFLRDMALGTTALLSRGAGGASGAGGESRRPSISADGGRVVFDSRANDLDPADGNGFGDVFLYDRATQALRAASTNPGGATGNGVSASADISPDGGWIAFESGCTDLGPADPNNLADVYVRSLATGAYVRIQGPSGTFNQASRSPRLSSAGRHVVFTTSATNLLPGGNPFVSSVVLFDRLSGALEVVSRSSAGVLGDQGSVTPRISDDGALVAFTSSATNLVPADGNAAFDVFARNVAQGWIERVSVAADGAELPTASRFPALSGSGRHTGFMSGVGTIVSNDTNNTSDVFLRDRGHDAPFAGSSFCDSTPNSTGAMARTTITGNPLVAAQDLTLTTRQLPANQFGFYVTSRDAAFVPGFGGSQGNLCLGGSIVRLDGFILNPGASGQVTLPLAFGQLPPAANLAPGDTWRFQFWFRDVVAGAATSNTSDAVCVGLL